MHPGSVHPEKLLNIAALFFKVFNGIEADPA
jgi:hypothetical protein